MAIMERIREYDEENARSKLESLDIEAAIGLVTSETDN